MGLLMASPTKHRTTGVYYFRERVPADLVEIAKGRRIVVPVGDEQRGVTIGAEVKVSLDAREPRIAKERHKGVSTAVQEIWNRFRQELTTGPITLTHKQIEALAGGYYRDLKANYEDEPGQPGDWEQIASNADDAMANVAAMERAFSKDVDDLLQKQGLSVDKATRRKLLNAIAKATIDASIGLRRMARGDYSPDQVGQRFPEWQAVKATSRKATKGEGITLTYLFGLWERDHLAENGPKKTVKEFRSKLNSFIAFIGHEAVDGVTPKSVADWLEHLRHDKGLSRKTVGEVYLVAVRRMFRVGIEKQEITYDPTVTIKYKPGDSTKTRDRDFTDDEAKMILSSALLAPTTLDRYAEHNRLAIRWGPWIAAYTGARIAEVMQLRKEDLKHHYGVLCLQITPTAGSTKTGRFRMNPIHPHLAENGLVEFINSRPDGPLFFVPKDENDDPAVRAKRVGMKVAEWVREKAGVTDPAVAPNHAWRHRFITLARDAGFPLDIRRAFTGHKDGSGDADYGRMKMETLQRWIDQFPRVNLSNEDQSIPLPPSF